MQQKSKRPSKTWVQCHARIFLDCSVLSASQRREHDNNYNHFTELSKLHSKIVLCKKEMKIPFLIFSSPPSCGQRHICPNPDLLISKPVEYQMSTSLVGHHRSWQQKKCENTKTNKNKRYKTHIEQPASGGISDKISQPAQQKVSGIDLKNCKAAVSLSVVC